MIKNEKTNKFFQFETMQVSFDDFKSCRSKTKTQQQNWLKEHYKRRRNEPR